MGFASPGCLTKRRVVLSMPSRATQSSNSFIFAPNLIQGGQLWLADRLCQASIPGTLALRDMGHLA